jgi:predicted metal-binding protein
MKLIAPLLLVAALFGALSAAAAGPEDLFVCGPCSRSFIDEAKAVVEELGVPDRVAVRKSSCLGACDGAPVIEFRGTVYSSMTADKLKSLLSSELGL